MKVRHIKKHYHQMIDKYAKQYDSIFVKQGNKRDRKEIFNGFKLAYRKNV